MGTGSGVICGARRWDQTRWRSVPCENKGKYDGYCGVHSPEQKEKRRKARGPTQGERYLARLDLKEKRQKALERVLEEARGVTGVLHPCGLHDSIAAYDKLMEEKP